MKTYSLNSLAESFEIDRSTMVRALKNTQPDAEVTRGRPTWKIASAACALDQHRRKAGNSPGKSDSANHRYNAIDPKLQSLYSQLDAADATLRALPTIAKRRAFAIKSLRPMIDEMQRMLKIVGSANDQDPEFTGLISDKLFMLALRGLEKPCDWTQSETWDAMNVETD
jgi:hypothetical protein